jgi:hypothetical protein
MSNGPESPNSANREEVDPGTAIDALAGFEYPASSGFLSLFRRKIYRRTTTAQVASFSWNIPGMVLLELCRILIQLLQVKHTSKGERT